MLKRTVPVDINGPEIKKYILTAANKENIIQSMIGRFKETDELNSLYNSNRAHLVAVYGRRRVGKTYLIDQVFKGKFAFRHAGLSPVEIDEGTNDSPLKGQLKHFYNSLILHGMKKSECPDNWLDMFLQLEIFLQSKDNGERQVVFLDELPWMDTHKSGFMTAFEGFWNNWGCHRENLLVIVCGSATSWITDHLINNHGGLYDRITYEIKLSPFTLRETDEYLQYLGVKLSKYDVVQAYMVTGGIPYYLSYFKKGCSLLQCVDNLFFSKNAKLKNEFERLFYSAFTNPEMMLSIVRALNTRNGGYTRQEIAELTNHKAGGRLSAALKALIESDFIVKYVPFGFSKRQEHYRLIDPFCLFYLKFVENQKKLVISFWQNNLASAQVVSWRGIAFENVCFSHIQQIKDALRIGGVSSEESAWSKKADDTDGTQIDLIIDRKDNIVNMCEIKFYSNEFSIDKNYHRTLINREELLSKELSPKMIIHKTLITTVGLKYNEYSSDFDSVITLDDLFKEY